jgi:hypothetical protein
MCVVHCTKIGSLLNTTKKSEKTNAWQSGQYVYVPASTLPKSAKLLGARHGWIDIPYKTYYNKNNCDNNPPSTISVLVKLEISTISTITSNSCNKGGCPLGLQTSTIDSWKSKIQQEKV